MSAALILYGSRARGEARPGSDVDLILAEDGESLRPPRTVHGVSVHLYSKGWLEKEIRAGSLFAYHVAFEGVALHDTDSFLERLRAKFRKKSSYREDAVTAALVLRMLLERDWQDNREARRRYFWAVRTIIISDAADHNTFLFASAALEAHAGICGLGKHVDGRETASFAECADFGPRVLHFAGALPPWRGKELHVRLLERGGIAYDSVRIVEEREAIEVGNLTVYL